MDVSTHERLTIQENFGNAQRNLPGTSEALVLASLELRWGGDTGTQLDSATNCVPVSAPSKKMIQGRIVEFSLRQCDIL